MGLTQGGHLFNSSIHKFFEIKNRATVGSLHVMSRDKRIAEPSNENAKPIASDGKFEQQIIEDKRK